MFNILPKKSKLGLFEINDRRSILTATTTVEYVAFYIVIYKYLFLVYSLMFIKELHDLFGSRLLLFSQSI